VAADVRRRLPADQGDRVRPYRGGYLAAERRAIEAELFGGSLQAVVATTALELGVDIGGLEACVLDGFPGTIASLWQQAGRAGREQQQSLAILVGGDDQLDQWFMANPRELFTRPLEPAVINPANPFVLLPHLACAAFETPLSHGDEQYWPGLLDDGVRALVQDDRLRVRRWVRGQTGPRAVWGGRGFPAHGVGLRSGTSEEFTIVDRAGDAVGTVDGSRAFEQIHPGAIYLHQGQAYRVAALEVDDCIAVVDPHDGDEYTLARSDTSFRVIDVDQVRPVGRAWLALGAVEVVSRVTGYQRKDAATGEILGAEPLELPATRLTTRAFWYTVDPSVLAAAGLEADRWPGTLHAVEHAGIGILPLFTICDRWDVGGVSTVHQADTRLPTIVIYDGYAGGAGIAELGFEAADRHLAATLDIVTACPCEAGCPSCVQSPKCGNWNEPLDKAGARRLLEVILGR
jgi:DEAD/DEAH box helicase domain-containing protein